MYVCAMSQISVQSTNGEFEEKRQDYRILSSLALIFLSGEAAKLFSAQSKSSSNSVSGIDRSSISFLLKCLLAEESLSTLNHWKKGEEDIIKQHMLRKSITNGEKQNP